MWRDRRKAAWERVKRFGLDNLRPIVGHQNHRTGDFKMLLATPTDFNDIYPDSRLEDFWSGASEKMPLL